MEPARSDETTEPPGYPQASSGEDDRWYRDPRPADPRSRGSQPTAVRPIPARWPWASPPAPARRPPGADQPAPEPARRPAVGPTQAVHGRAGGPGLTAPPGAIYGLLSSEGRSGWQTAQKVWVESGVSWEAAGFAPVTSPGAGRFDQHDRRVSVRDEPADTDAEFRPDDDDPARDWNNPAQDWPGPGPGPGPGAMPLSAPVTTMRRPPRPPEPTPPPRSQPARPMPATTPDGEPDALFQAWQGSVRQAANPRGHWPARRPGLSARRRRGAWRAAAIGVPAVVIVTVGAGALILLTGRANEMLAVRGDTETATPGAAAAGAAAGAHHVTSVVLPGYPGQPGTVAAAAMGSAAGVTLAVGDANGHPAIWRQAGASWSLVAAAVLGAVPGAATLTALAHGPAGWIAVGLTVRGGVTYPLVLTSADGVSWQSAAALPAAAGSQVELLGVAAGPHGYAVVGRRTAGRLTSASLWWSTDLRTWTPGTITGSSASAKSATSTANAVAVTAAGLVAVGSQGAEAATWTSSDGSHWTLRGLIAPSGAPGATLRQVVVAGHSIAATGYAAGPTGKVPLAMASTDDGATWRSAILPDPDGFGLVTALTTKGGTLIAAGQAGGAATGHLVTWTSRDGLHWSAGAAVAGVRQLAALAGYGGTLTGLGSAAAAPGAATPGADSAVVTIPAP